MDNEDLVSVYTVTTATEAEIVPRSALQSVGIPAQVGGETQAGLAGVLAIDVLTSASDAEAARKYLRQLRKEKKERRRRHLESKRAHEESPSSEAIQEIPPPLPSTGIEEHDDD